MKKLFFILLLCPLLSTAQNVLPRFLNDTLYTSSGYTIYKGRELVVLGEFERRRAGHELVVDGGAVRVALPERALLRRLGHREPAAERAFDVRREVGFVEHEGDELLGRDLVLRVLEDHAGLDRGAVGHLAAVGFVREGGRGDQLGVVLLRGGALRFTKM